MGRGAATRGTIRVGEAGLDLGDLIRNSKDAFQHKLHVHPVDDKGYLVDGAPPLGQLTVSVEAVAALRRILASNQTSSLPSLSQV